MHYQTISKLLANPAKFTFEQAFEIAALLEVDGLAIVTLIGKEIAGKPKRKK
jgi:hypothetical protein